MTHDWMGPELKHTFNVLMKEASIQDDRRNDLARWAEEDRICDIKSKRQAAGQCEHCGNFLGFIDRLFKRKTHLACKTYKD